MRLIDPHVTCAFLYTITRYGYPPKAENMVTYINEMADLGFQSIELEGIGEEHLNTVYARRREIKAAIEARGLRLPVFCVVMPGIASPHREIAARSLKLFERGCELAEYFGARGVLDNGPLVPYEFPADMPVHRHYSPEVLGSVSLPAHLEWHAYWDELLARMDTACRLAADHGLSYYMHPCTGSLTDTTDGYLVLKNALGRDNLKFNFDTSNQHYMRENLALGLLKVGGELDYIHISDSTGSRIEHQPTGRGNIDWDLIFSTLRQTGFKGELSIDVGGDESHVADLDGAYLDTAQFLERKIKEYELYK